jgi:hypothetical protein
MSDKRVTRAQTHRGETVEPSPTPSENVPITNQKKGQTWRPIGASFQYGIIYEFKSTRYTYASLVESVKNFRTVTDSNTNLKQWTDQIDAQIDQYQINYDTEVYKDKTERKARKLGGRASFERKVAKQILDDAKGLKKTCEKILTDKVNTGHKKQELIRAWKAAEEQLEDFLYYQNILNRRTRIRHLTDLDKNHNPKPTHGRQKLFSIRDDEINGLWKKGLLDHYDYHAVGDPSEKGAEGDVWPLRKEPIPAEELHLWKPAGKRRLAASENDIDMPRNKHRRVYDVESIERERQKHEGDESTARSKQRREELRLINTVKTGNLGAFKEKHSYTESGVWISAAETSDDWTTSYCRGEGMTSPTSTPTSSSSSSSSSPSTRRPSLSPSSPPRNSPTDPDENDPYDSDEEDELLLAYRDIVRRIYGPRST